MIKKFLVPVFFTLNAFFLCSQSLIITNVNVIPIEGGESILKNQTVFITDGKIADIIPFKAEHAYKESTIINGAGKYLIPGLADMHVHFPDEKETSLDQFFKLTSPQV